MSTQVRIALAGQHQISGARLRHAQQRRRASLTVSDEERLEVLEPVGAEAVQRASREKERSRHAKFAQHGQRVVSVARQVVIEGHRHRGASFASHRPGPLPVLCQDLIDGDEVNDFAERLQLRPEHLHRNRRNDLAARWRGRAESVVDQNKAVSADARKRAHSAVHRRRSQEGHADAPRQRDH